MKIAIMQPYLFPYIGYFQLINSVDTFVIYDDVAFIKQGWINRNKLLLNRKDFVFSVPLKDMSSFEKINNTQIKLDIYEKWKRKILTTLTQAYSRAPFYNKVYELITLVFDIQTSTISDLVCNSLKETCQYLNITTQIIPTSAIYQNSELKGTERIIDICLTENADTYINPIGGIELYDKLIFKNRGIQLKFIKSNNIIYKQFNNDFVPYLSIIDVMMFNSPEKIKDMLHQYELI